MAALVAAHGGTVWVESPPGGGAIFRIAIPLAPEARYSAPGIDDGTDPDLLNSDYPPTRDRSSPEGAAPAATRRSCPARQIPARRPPIMDGVAPGPKLQRLSGFSGRAPGPRG